MVNNIMNWAIFGLVGILWTYVIGWATADGSVSVAIMVFISLVTASFVNGTTSGGNGIEHMMDGIKGCVNVLVGWVVAALVHDIGYGLIFGGGVDVNALMQAAMHVAAMVVVSVLAFSALNAARE